MIKQISVFVENKPGRLSAVTQVLFDKGINLRAFTIADAGDFGVIRMVVDKTEEAYKALKEAGFTVTVNEVLAVEVEDKPGELFKISKALGDAGVNIEYVYAFTSKKRKALIIFRVSDSEKAKQILEKMGVLFKGEIE
ncbi:MAG: ACT domain-containing protein [Archaeoglobaceae archaeon]